MSSSTTTTLAPVSRAVQRRVEAGCSATCASCDQQIKFAARQNRQQVIANVYGDGRWTRVEHFHLECYETAGAPYGGPAQPPAIAARRQA